MVQHTQSNQTNNDDNIKILESQIRECFGRVVFTHKTHEKCSDIYADQLKNLKLFEIVLSALTTTSLLSSVFGEQKIGTIIGTILSTIILGITIYTKDYDLGQISKNHVDAANKLWNIRELYISLIADIKTGSLTIEEIKLKRDGLQDSLNLVYQNALRTNYKAYERASKSLNKNGQINTGEEMTFSDEEIDRFLPHDLRRNQ
jgi:SMODS and SLOG-associating 2TM effector domain family 4